MTLPYAAVIARESARAADAMEQAAPDARVPSCSDWSVLDLAYHLGEVQDSWYQLVEKAPADFDAVEETERRPDSELVPYLRTRTAALLDAIGRRDPGDPCYSWSPSGGDVAWVMRRQAHEALVHRVDAEQTAGLPVTTPDHELAVDGVDEIVGVVISGLPAWATFTPGGPRLRLRAAGTDATWVLMVGRFTGTSPNTGKVYDDESAEAEPDTGQPVDAEISAPAWDLDLWLWGRTGDDVVTVSGDDAAVGKLRAVIAAGTQ